MQNKLIFPVALLSLLTLAAAPATQPTTQPTTQPAYLAPDNFDFKTLLGDPPTDQSDTQTQEIDSLLKFQLERSPDEVARCKDEVNATAFIFSDVLGKSFNPNDLPTTAALFKEVTQQTKVVSSAAKATWARKRPFLIDARLKPCVELEETASYPSGHATRGMVWAILLAEIYPDQHEALLARGRQFGTDRALAGVHYPTDVAAGQKLGAEIAKRLLADPDFHARLEKVKEEEAPHSIRAAAVTFIAPTS